ncbi:MAG: hypothetical protein PVI91_14430 [Gammaproteobacteria bacterium]
MRPVAVRLYQGTAESAFRVGVTWLEGDYRVTDAHGEHVKSWTLRGGKVTSEPAKGYYYFWAGGGKRKYYVQTPITRTYIEELD